MSTKDHAETRPRPNGSSPFAAATGRPGQDWGDLLWESTAVVADQLQDGPVDSETVRGIVSNSRSQDIYRQGPEIFEFPGGQ